MALQWLKTKEDFGNQRICRWLEKIFDVETRQNFKKRNVVLYIDGQYPQEILIELHGENVSLVEHYREGMNVDIYVNIRGRKWIDPQGEEKYFNTIVGWKITNNQR